MSTDSLSDCRALALRTLRQTRPFTHWPDASVETLVDAGRLARYSRRTQVLAHDPARREVLVVLAGVLEVSRSSESGKRFVLNLVGPGSTLALVRLLEDVANPYQYYAHDDTLLLHLPSDAMLTALDDCPVLWRDVATLVLERQWDYLGSLRDLALASLRQRVATLLAAMAHRHGTSEPGGLALQLRLSQDDLGAMLGVSRQSVAKELRALEKAGIVGTDYSCIAIRDLDQLDKLATRLSFSGV